MNESENTKNDEEFNKFQKTTEFLELSKIMWKLIKDKKPRVIIFDINGANRKLNIEKYSNGESVLNVKIEYSDFKPDIKQKE